MIKIIYYESLNIFRNYSSLITRILEIFLPFAVMEFIISQINIPVDNVYTLEVMMLWIIAFWANVYTAQVLWSNLIPYNFWLISNSGAGTCAYIRVSIYYVTFQLIPILILIGMTKVSFTLTFIVIFAINQLNIFQLSSLTGLMLHQLKLADQNLVLMIIPITIPLSILPILYYFDQSMIMQQQIIQLILGISLILHVIIRQLYYLIIKEFYYH
ncbi:MAG: hypothetical protein CMF42_00435 [Legionellales bacterium]|nr:hypothetical protein [Legionellales bacterium]|tara:strand:+ start:29 stop:670 length:642 start_codon:yes stop_codon:yes gene_type:complete